MIQECLKKNFWIIVLLIQAFSHNLFSMGFNNLKNTCNLNALLQMFVHMPSLSSRLESMYTNTYTDAERYYQEFGDFAVVMPTVSPESVITVIALFEIANHSVVDAIRTEGLASFLQHDLGLYFKPFVLFVENTTQCNDQFRQKFLGRSKKESTSVVRRSHVDDASSVQASSSWYSTIYSWFFGSRGQSMQQPVVVASVVIEGDLLVKKEQLLHELLAQLQAAVSEVRAAPEVPQLLCCAYLVVSLGECIKNYKQNIDDGIASDYPLEVQQALQLLAVKNERLARELTRGGVRYGSHHDQHDIDEVYKIIFECITASGLICANILAEVVAVHTQSHLILDCGHPKTPAAEVGSALELNCAVVNTMADLKRVNQERVGLGSLLSDFFAPEHLALDSAVFCETCLINRETTKQIQLTGETIPSSLSLLLKRNMYVAASHAYALIKRKIEIPLVLDLSKDYREPGVCYALQGFVCRLGNDTKAGHFVSYFQQDGQWFFADDGAIRPVAHFIARNDQVIKDADRLDEAVCYLDDPSIVAVFYERSSHGEAERFASRVNFAEDIVGDKKSVRVRKKNVTPEDDDLADRVAKRSSAEVIDLADTDVDEVKVKKQKKDGVKKAKNKRKK